MKVELKHITPNAVELIGGYAGICYGSSNTKEANIRRAKHCLESGHLSTLRHAIASFHISGISRVCSHQMVRHKHLEYLQKSQRYCKEDKPNFTIPNTGDRDLDQIILSHYVQCGRQYNFLISNGVRKEDARFVLPEATHTELLITGNFQAWRDFIKLRANKHAQWEIRQVAVEINNQLAHHVPELFEVTNV